MRNLLVGFGLAFALAAFGCGGDDDTPGMDGGDGTCSATSQCGGSRVCACGECVAAGSVGSGACCWATRDCAGGLFCEAGSADDGTCAAAGDGAEGDTCSEPAQCEAGLTCTLVGLSGSCQTAGNSDRGQACSADTDCLAGLACATDGTCRAPAVAYPPFSGVQCAGTENPFKVYFEVPRPGNPPADFFRAPFPSVIRVDASGNLDMSDFPEPGVTPLGIDVVTAYRDALVDDFNGFSSSAVVTFRFSNRLQFDTATGSTVRFIDITPDTAQYGVGLGRTWTYSTGGTKYNCPHRFAIRGDSRNPLLPGHTYAVYLTNGLVGEDSGQAAVQDDDLAAVLGDERPADEDLGRAWDAHAGFREYLVSEGLSSVIVSGVAVFTVKDTIAPARAIATATMASPAPMLSDLTLCDGATTSPCDDGGQRACGDVSADFHEIHGRISIPIFQQGTAPYVTAADGGAIQWNGATPQIARTENVCFALTIPKSAMPGGGWPLVVFGPGTGGSFRGAIANEVASSLATASTPTATLAVEPVVHGARRNGVDIEPDQLMFNIVNPRATRDNVLQGGADIVQALRVPALGTITLPGAGATSFDGTRAYYFGHSQGANVGVPVIATSELTDAIVLSGAGAFLSRSLTTKTSPFDTKAGIEFLLGERFDDEHPVMTLWQMYFDEVDNINYAPILVRRSDPLTPKHVFFGYGLNDTYATPATLKAFALAAGWSPVQPLLEDIGVQAIPRPVSLNATGNGQQVTAAVFQYQPADYDGHFVMFRNAGAIADWVEFLMTLIETGTPTVN